MEVKKYDKIILDSSRSIDDIVASIKAELSKKESENAGESYICYVSHAYSSGENAGVSYIVVSDGFKELKRLSSNVIKASAYSKDEINELIATKVDRSELDNKSSELNSRIDSVNNSLTNSINAKANSNAVVGLSGNQTINGVKTFSSPIVVPNGTANNHAVNLAQLNTKANQATTYTKTEVDVRINSLVDSKANRADTYNKTEVNDLLNVKANSNAVITLTGNETIFGDKAFISPVIVPDGTVSNHAVNLSQLNDKANANSVVNLWDNQTINGVKTFSSPVIVPNAIHHHQAVNLGQLNAKADINYVKKRGGFVNVNFNLAGGQGILIDLNLGINFNVIIQSGVSANMRVVNAASNIGQSGEIYVANGAGVSGFSAPFNFRVAQSGFGTNEVFSYLVVSANLVRITRS